MKRIEASPEEAEGNIYYLSTLFKYQLIKNLMFDLKKITKNYMMCLSINFANRRIKLNLKNEGLIFGQHPLAEKSPPAIDT